jgi:hypothetical protein
VLSKSATRILVAQKVGVSTPYRIAIIHSVPDYERWANVIRERRGVNRDLPGQLAMTVFRSIDDSNEVMVTLEAESEQAAREAIPSADALRELLDRAGIDIYPPVFIGQIVRDLSSRRE